MEIFSGIFLSADHLTRFQLLGLRLECGLKYGWWNFVRTQETKVKGNKLKINLCFMNIKTSLLDVKYSSTYHIPDYLRIMFTITEQNQFTRAAKLRSVNRIIFFTLIPFNVWQGVTIRLPSTEQYNAALVNICPSARHWAALYSECDGSPGEVCGHVSTELLSVRCIQTPAQCTQQIS